MTAGQDHEVSIFTANGQHLNHLVKARGTYELNLSQPGIFLLQFKGKDGKVQVEKVVVQ